MTQVLTIARLTILEASRRKLLLAARAHDTPIAIPHFLLRLIRSRDSRTGAIASFGVKKSFAVEIAHSEVREVQIANVPRGSFRRITSYAGAKKGQLESELAAIRGLQIPRVIPPFGSKIGMVEEVSREFVMVAWQCRLELSKSRR